MYMQNHKSGMKILKDVEVAVRQHRKFGTSLFHLVVDILPRLNVIILKDFSYLEKSDISVHLHPKNISFWSNKTCKLQGKPYIG